MTAFCEITAYRFAARIEYSCEQDILLNRSVIHIRAVQLRSLWSGPVGNCWVTGSIRVNGLPAAELRLTDTESCGIYNLGQSYAGGGDGTWGGFHSADVTAEHLADGSCELTIRAELRVMLTSGTLLDPGINAAVTAALPGIPRASELAVTPSELGQETVIRLSRASERFRDTLRWTCGARSGTIAEKTPAAEFRWTAPVELASQAPDAQTAAVTFIAETFDGDTPVGSRSLTAECPIPAAVVPAATAAVSDAAGYAHLYGEYIQAMSRIRVVTDARGAYGSTVANIAVTCGGLAGSGADVTFLAERSGVIPVTVTVTDSRGRRATQNISVTALPYARPSAVIRQAFRCDALGESRADGAYLKLVFDAEAANIPGSAVTYQASARARGSTQTRTAALTEYAGLFSVTGGTAVLPAGTDSDYDCAVTVTDSFGSAQSATVPVPAAFVLLDFLRSAGSVGIGRRARGTGLLSIGMDADLGGHRIENAADPENDADAATKHYVDLQIRSLLTRLGLE